MNVYLSTTQAKNIVFQLMEIIPDGVSVTDEVGHILASTDSKKVKTVSALAERCVKQATTEKLYNERLVEGSETATPLFFKDICVGAVLMLGNVEQVKRLTSIVKAVGESVLYQPYIKDGTQVADIINFEFLTEWLNTPGEYSLSMIRRGIRYGVDITQPYCAVIIDSVWNPLSAQKAVESCLMQSNYYVCMNNKSIVLILHKDYDPTMLTQLSELLHDVKIAVGNIDISLNRSFVIAQNTLFAGKRLDPDKTFYDYSDYELAYALSCAQHIHFSDGITELFEQPIHKDLLQTMEVFFNVSGNQADAVSRLYIHRNTLKYRLDRIQEMTGKNPRVFQDLFYLYTAYILYKLKK